MQEFTKEDFSMPIGSEARWNFYFQAIFAICKNFKNLVKITEFIKNLDKFDSETRNKFGSGLNKILKKKQNLSLCYIFL